MTQVKEISGVFVHANCAGPNPSSIPQDMAARGNSLRGHSVMVWQPGAGNGTLRCPQCGAEAPQPKK